MNTGDCSAKQRKHKNKKFYMHNTFVNVYYEALSFGEVFFNKRLVYRNARNAIINLILVHCICFSV